MGQEEGHRQAVSSLTPETTAEELVTRCQAGNAAAFEELYRRYANRVYRHLVTLLGAGPDAEDCLQAVFLTAFNKLHAWDRTSLFSTWLHGIALRQSLNARRARRRRAAAMQAHERERRSTAPRTPERSLMQREETQRLFCYLERVSDKKRAAFLLYYVEQLPLDEVAARTGTSVHTAAARIKYARAEIRKALERDQLALRRRDGVGP